MIGSIRNCLYLVYLACILWINNIIWYLVFLKDQRNNTIYVKLTAVLLIMSLFVFWDVFCEQLIMIRNWNNFIYGTFWILYTRQYDSRYSSQDPRAKPLFYFITIVPSYSTQYMIGLHPIGLGIGTLYQQSADYT